MAHPSQITRTLTYRYSTHIGRRSKWGYSVNPSIKLIMIAAVYQLIFYGWPQPCFAQAPQSFSSTANAQQSFITKYAQLQGIIDASSGAIRSQMFEAQGFIASINSQRIQKNIETDQQLAKDLLQLSGIFGLAAFEIPRSTTDKFLTIVDVLEKSSGILESVQARLDNDQQSRLLASQASQKLSTIKASAVRLKQLMSDRDRLAAEGQKAGLLPDINYNPKAGTFTVTSPQRTTQQTAQNAQLPKQPTATATSSVVQTPPSALPTSPDPLALAILYETVLVYEADLVALNKAANRARVDAFAKCMIEHRTSKAVIPNELWEYLTRSAQLLREKGVVDVYWPPAQRERELRPRAKEFEFRLSQKTLRDMSARPVNALFPGTVRAAGFTYPEMTLSIQAMGFSDFQTCTKIPKLNNNPPKAKASDDDDDN